ncbi:MAG: 1-acyl-sn-glycerol-3-phosphate acyltransferase [Flavobacterium sp.]|nr:1-acyl-sn-glycerol-3-phosphate acyltransferase [Flavobacterium sp.]
MKKRLYGWIFFRVLGWRMDGRFDPAIRKCVFIIVPHTSWFDFIIGLFVRGTLNIDIAFVAKKELFRFPFGQYFTWMGGTPIDRSGGLNKVDAIASVFESKDVFRLAIAPEGTRKHVSRLKTGFYYIAVKAKVPIIAVAFDYKTKTVKIAPPYYPSSNIKADLPEIQSFFKGVSGKVGKYSFTPPAEI